MSRYQDFWDGVEARRKGDACPVDQSCEFINGYGMEYAAEHANPPITLEELDNLPAVAQRRSA